MWAWLQRGSDLVTYVSVPADGGTWTIPFDDDTALSILQRKNPLDTAFVFYRDEGTTRDE